MTPQLKYKSFATRITSIDGVKVDTADPDPDHAALAAESQAWIEAAIATPKAKAIKKTKSRAPIQIASFKA